MKKYLKRSLAIGLLLGLVQAVPHYISDYGKYYDDRTLMQSIRILVFTTLVFFIASIVLRVSMESFKNIRLPHWLRGGITGLIWSVLLLFLTSAGANAGSAAILFVFPFLIIGGVIAGVIYNKLKNRPVHNS